MARHGHDGADEVSVPPVLPLVQVTVRAADDVEILVDGEMLLSGPIDRASLGRVLGTIVAERGVPVRVEILEADGRRFADIVTPIARPSRFAPPEASVPDEPSPIAAPVLYRIEGEGFLPGEDVGIAIVLRTTAADGLGHAGLLLDHTELPDGHLGVLLFGFISGTLHTDGLA